MSYYLPPDTPMIGVSRFNQNGEWQQGLLEKRLAQLTRNYSGVWLVLTHSPPKLKTRLLAWFDEHYQKQRQKKFSSVSVVLLTRRANHD
jgi:hypothetical protein